MADLLARVEQLEKANRYLKMATTIVPLLMTILGMLAGCIHASSGIAGTERGNEMVPTVIRTNRLDVLDEMGRVRISLMTNENQPSINLYDEQGKVRASLDSTESGSSLSFSDATYVSRVLLHETALSFRDESGKLQMLYGNRALSLFDDEGHKAANLFTDEQGPRLLLYDEMQKARVILASSKSGPALLMWDSVNKPRIEMDVIEDSPLIKISDTENNTVWSALPPTQKAP